MEVNRRSARDNPRTMYAATLGKADTVSTYRVRIHADEFEVEAGRPIRAASNCAASELIAPGEVLRVKHNDSDVVRCYRVLESFEVVPIKCEDSAK